ncbi:hypothetical protein BXZ70DRAFT_991302 [Cristinia sonorae]|uniref:BTB domain-containing protein n=1 Tax=Cristinia sonorae TaxID=1940300 RepID=A0A8K0XN88_9AGAR|nr:hypothetical protein BXZ70DRAFT_991302 [Cristinia sonorae]
MSGFGESIDPTAAIASILGTYPFSIGLLREILQNSDDAKADTQIFLLDHRTHGTKHLLHDGLSDAQGPALLAYNNSTFSEDDWVALQRIHQSSKRADTSKIGKYGIGFRSCYHITDTPQIISGRFLAVLDPHHKCFPEGGSKVDFTVDAERHADHLAAFNIDRMVPSYKPGTPLKGTIVRLPLRCNAFSSRISNKTLTPDEIRRLLVDFVDQEMETALLFLSHLTSISVKEIQDRKSLRLGKCKRKQSELQCSLSDTTHWEISVSSTKSSTNSKQKWRVVEVRFPSSDCAEILSQRLGYDAREALEKEKLLPVVAIAVPTPLEPGTFGRLFTYLPLPLPTGFPCHIHALFALTQARQNLWNCSEHGLVSGTRDELLVVWNQVLFGTFIPRAWATLLQLLSESLPGVEPADHFNAWPPAVQHASGGDPFYWQNVGLDFLRVLAEEKQPVWPVAGSDEFASIDNVLIGLQEHSNYVPALSAAGVDITLPPENILTMLDEADYGDWMLNPESAHTVMSEDATPILVLSEVDKRSVLEFLLSTGDVELIIGIFVVPLLSGDYTALEEASDSRGRNYVILRGPEEDLFAPFDDDAIGLSRLPPKTRELFTHPDTPSAVNVTLLDCARAVEYLGAATEGREGTAGNKLTKWLFRFWAWAVTWHERNKLFAMIQDIPLLPDTDGYFHPLSGTLFRLDGIDNMKQKVFSAFDLSFLHPSFPQSAVTYLETEGVLKSVHSAEALLEYLRPRKPHGLSQEEISTLSQHLATSLMHHSGRLSNSLRAQLKELPVFPVMTPPQTVNNSTRSQPHTPQTSLAAVTHFASLPKDRPVHLVDVNAFTILAQPMKASILLPDTQGTIFAARAFRDQDYAPLVFHAAGISTSVLEVNVIELFIEKLSIQSKRLQKAFLDCLVAHRQAITPAMLRKLASHRFVPVGNGKTLASPSDVVDPKHQIARILDSNDVRLPRTHDPVIGAIVQSLRSLGLLRTTLTDTIVQERLRKISKSASNKGIATHLLHILNDAEYDCSGLKSELALPWLPTSKGLRRPSDCRDDSTLCNRALFDLVLDVLDVREFSLTSESLRAGLGWDEELSLDVVRRQMEAELRGDASVVRITLIIRELGRRVDEIETSDLLKEFKDGLFMQDWIPVVGGELASSMRALLCTGSVPPGFDRVLPTFMAEEGTVRFLELMGCSDRASNSAIIEEIHTFGNDPLPSDHCKDVFRLLRFLDIDDLTDDQLSDLLIPDKDCRLQPIESLYYDDLGLQAYEVDIPEDLYKAHEDVSSILTPRLGLQTLSSLNLTRVEEADDDDGDDDMQEDLPTRISNVLRQYSIDQAFNEFLANAADAGASHYEIILDKKPGKSDNILSPTMAQFQSCSSLILYNQAEFKPEDFKGIRSVGRGGKQNRNDAIGKFGLGALSMFHFTELSMIVSGGFVMFLDPSKSYLPPKGRRHRASLRVPLADMWRLHSDHLNVLCGIHGFESGLTFYKGTLFRLPLRNDSQCSVSLLSNDPISDSHITKLIMDYGNVAPQSLLNIGVCSITALERDTAGSLTPLWSAKASRHISRDDNPKCQEVKLVYVDNAGARRTESWHLVTERDTLQTLPEEFKGLPLKHRIREVSVTLAGLTSSGGKPPICKLYSRLPLPTVTALPVHIDASFILADDRRSIRLDGSGELNLESKYNCWLLSDRIPSLYTFLLETWPQKDNEYMWPGHPRLPDDPISTIVINEFYKSHFAPSLRKFCQSMTGRRLTPSEAVFVDTESIGVKQIIKALKPSNFVQLSKRLRLKSLVIDGVKALNADALRDAIVVNSTNFRTAFREKDVKVEDVDNLIQRMFDEAPSSLLNLPILPLANDGLSSIRSPASGPTRYYAPSSEQLPWPLFSAVHFVHPGINCKKLIDSPDIDIRLFSGGEALKLMEPIIPRHRTAGLNAWQEDWVMKFWAQADHLDIDKEALAQFALVPLDEDGQYVSLAFCEEAYVLAYRPRDEQELSWLGPIMKSLGATMVELPEDCPAALKRAVKDVPRLLLDLDNILRFLDTLDASWTEQFLANVGMEDQRRFSDFCISQLRSLRSETRTTNFGKKGRKIELLVSVQHLDVARQLPIWESRRGNMTLFVAANDTTLRMLPGMVSLSLSGPFLGDFYAYTSYDERLMSVLGVQPLDFESFIDSLELPETLPDLETITAYNALLEGIVHQASAILSDIPVKVPNTNGTLLPVNQLFSRDVPLFFTVFGDQSPRFVHDSVRDLETPLRALGLRGTANFSSFKICATTVHNEDFTDGNIARATAVYQYYSMQLWQYLTKNNALWEEVVKLRFIPRGDVRRHYQTQAFDPDDYALALPSVVSPNEILRSEFEAVAWTQRALPLEPPSERLLLANLNFGVPTIDEVVDHLRQLVIIADEFPNNRDLLSDLTATYKWLMVHKDEAECQEVLLECKNELLFLNVDDTNSEWTFAPARRILFNGLDEGDWQYARDFLLQFKDLLLVVGAKEIKQAVRPPLKLSSADQVLVHLRSALNKQRLDRTLTDVELLSSDEPAVSFAAHKAILAASTRHFEAMFGKDWSEHGGRVSTGETAVVLQYALDYIYVGSIEELDSQEDLLGLLELSDRWDLPELFGCVENQLIATISLGTYEELQEVGEKYAATTLVEACNQFQEDNAHAL